MMNLADTRIDHVEGEKVGQRDDQADCQAIVSAERATASRKRNPSSDSRAL